MVSGKDTITRAIKVLKNRGEIPARVDRLVWIPIGGGKKIPKRFDAWGFVDLISLHRGTIRFINTHCQGKYYEHVNKIRESYMDELENILDIQNATFELWDYRGVKKGLRIKGNPEATKKLKRTAHFNVWIYMTLADFKTNQPLTFRCFTKGEIFHYEIKKEG